MFKKSITLVAMLSLLLSLPVLCADAADTAADVTKATYLEAEMAAADFDAQINIDGYVILDFYADWCPPCKRLIPIFTKLASQYPNIRFIKVNVDSKRDLVGRYGIRSMPTLIVLQNGAEIKRHVGFMNEQMLINWLASYA